MSLRVVTSECREGLGPAPGHVAACGVLRRLLRYLEHARRGRGGRISEQASAFAWTTVCGGAELVQKANPNAGAKFCVVVACMSLT